MGIIKKTNRVFFVYLFFKIRELCSAFIYFDEFDPNFAYLRAVAPLLLLLIPCKKNQDLMGIVSFSSLL